METQNIRGKTFRKKGRWLQRINRTGNKTQRNKSSVFCGIRCRMIYDFITAIEVIYITVFKRKFLYLPLIPPNSEKCTVG